MITVARYKQLKDEADRAQREADRIEGALREAAAVLKNDFGCASLEEADGKLQKLLAEAARAEAEVDTVLAEYERDYPNTR